jgi:hypothetical protein
MDRLTSMLLDYDLMYGLPGSNNRGLLPTSEPVPLPPDTMTRQRRRQAERERAKGR